MSPFQLHSGRPLVLYGFLVPEALLIVAAGQIYHPTVFARHALSTVAKPIPQQAKTKNARILQKTCDAQLATWTRNTKDLEEMLAKTFSTHHSYSFTIQIACNCRLHEKLKKADKKLFEKGKRCKTRLFRLILGPLLIFKKKKSFTLPKKPAAGADFCC